MAVRVLIVGAGIGGLTAALALRQAGFDVHIYEQASQLREVGAGVAISPNAVKVLHALGLAEALKAVAVTSQSLDSRDWHTGALLGRVPLAAAALTRWDAPFYHLHRADLHAALRDAVGDRHITLGARCVAVEQDGIGVELRFANGYAACGDVLVGADGVHSVVREHVAGPDQAIWSRQISWRGLAPASVGQEVGLELRHHSFWGPRKHFVTFYVGAGRLVNWAANTEAEDEWREESWSARGDRHEVLAAHAATPAGWCASQTPWKWPPATRAWAVAQKHRLNASTGSGVTTCEVRLFDGIRFNFRPPWLRER